MRLSSQRKVSIKTPSLTQLTESPWATGAPVTGLASQSLLTEFSKAPLQKNCKENKSRTLTSQGQTREESYLRNKGKALLHGLVERKWWGAPAPLPRGCNLRMTRICKTETFHPGKRVGWQEHSSIISGRENLYRHCKIRMAVPQKAGNRSPSRYRHNILWHIPKELHPTIETLAHTFLTALFITAINWKQPRCPSTGDENVVHLHIGALFSCSKNKQLQNMTWNSQVNGWSWKKIITWVR